MKYKVSIIIPHKNTPELLQRCLDTIPDREDIQIIIVDDNSDPKKVDFQHFPGYDRKNVESIFTHAGKGAGYARNQGLFRAQGKWLMFADADDYYTEKINNLFNKYSSANDIDIVYFNCTGTSQSQNRCSNYNKMIDEYVRGNSDAEKKIKYNFWVPWNKMFNSSFIQKHNLRFEEVMTGNDAKFSLLASYYSEKIIIDPNYYYVSVIRSDGITLKRKTLQERLYSLSTMLRIWNFLEFVDAKYDTYHKNIIGFKVLLSVYKQYGINGLYKYLRTYYKEKQTHNLYPELKKDGTHRIDKKS